MTVIQNRRELITGLIAFAAAPAIVRASSLMPVKQMMPLTWLVRYVVNVEEDGTYGVNMVECIQP